MTIKSSYLKNAVAATAIAYSLTVLIASLWNLIAGGFGSSVGSLFFVEVLAVLILLQFLNWLLGVTIEKPRLYLTVFYILAFLIFEGAGILFHWFGLSIRNILITTVLFIGIASSLYRCFLHKQKADSDTINRQLNKPDRD